jgi:hypothetical protein
MQANPARRCVHPASRQLGRDYLMDPHGVHYGLREELPAVPVRMPRGNHAWMVTKYDVRGLVSLPVRTRP